MWYKNLTKTKKENYREVMDLVNTTNKKVVSYWIFVNVFDKTFVYKNAF